MQEAWTTPETGNKVAMVNPTPWTGPARCTSLAYPALLQPDKNAESARL